MFSGKLLLSLCFPHLANLVHLLVLMFHACLWSKYSHFSLITFFWVKIEVRSKQNQLISGCIKGVMLRHPWSAFTLLPCLPVSSKYSHRHCISAKFIYSLPHSLFYLIQSTFSPLSPNALSANNLKFVCHCGDTEGHCPSYYFPSPPPSSLIYNTSYWVWSKANWIPVKYLYFSLICLI